MVLDLVVVPPETSDLGSQRCRLGPVLMEDLGLRLGSPVLVTLQGGASCLCTAWPRPDLAEAYLQVDPTCSSAQLRLDALRGLRLGSEGLRALSCPRVKRLRVTALVRSGEFKRRTSAQEVGALAAELLTGLYVHEKHLVDISHAGTPIHSLQVDSVNSGSHKAGRVTPETRVDVVSVRTFETYQRWEREGSSVSLGGLEEVYVTLKEMLTLPLRYPISTRRVGVTAGRGALLVGPPGVGKTQLVRSVAQDVQAALVTVSGPVVVGSRPGESEENLRAAFTRASEAAREEPCVLFIDEIDALCPKRSSSTGTPENRLVAQLLTLMDGVGSDEGFVIIGATNRPDALDPALRRPGRFDREIVVGVPTLQQRYQVLQCVCRSVPLSPNVDLYSIADKTSGYVGADLSALSREAVLHAILHSTQGRAEDSGQSEGEDGKVRMEHFVKAMRMIAPSCLRSSVGVAEFTPVNWERIGGLEEVKLKLRQSVEWPMKFPEAFVRLGVCRARGVLLYGPPGCAKTTLVKAAAYSSHCSFLCLSGAELYSPYVGDSEKALAQLFQQARACSPSIVFLDEIDSLVGCRGDGGGCRGSSVQAQVLSVLLNELDGVGFKTTERRGTGRSERQETHRDQRMQLQEVCNQDVMIVAATNRPDMLDSALLRPGRFDYIIYVPPPDLQARQAILKLHTEKMPLNSNVCLEDLATRTNLFSGADLENLCKEAALLALHEEGMSVSTVQQKHFQKVLQHFQPSISSQQLLELQQLFKHNYN